MRTVRSAAYARNQPRPRTALLVLAVLALLALLVARVDAAPAPIARTTSSGASDGEPEDAPVAGELATADADDGAIVATANGPPDALVDPAAAAEAARAAPSVRAAIAAAYRVAGLAADPAPGFADRSRLAALVPWIGVRVGQDDTWSDVIDPTIGHMFVYDVRATWHFDRLVFDANELRAHGMELSRRRERRRLALLVSRTYYTWLRARAAAGRVPAWALRADQAAADLESLTDGAWTAR